MIGISKLYCATVEPSDTLRYSRHSGKLPSHLLQFSKDKKPVVVWNMTRRCNLKCVHCYAQSENIAYDNELTHEQSLAMMDDLAQFGVPVLLFSGGEPLMHPRLVEYAQYAVSKGMRAVISTNGTLITKEKAKQLKEVGLSYVGISLDGLEATHDKFRGVEGAYKNHYRPLTTARKQVLRWGCGLP
jgi:MoaA/NifB/PqqE/SkfB family radical SAM enzyme